jgi:hypothetical protein
MLIDPEYGNLRHFDSKIVEYDDAKDECTIFATDASEDRQTTAWLSAQEGSYVSAWAMR